MDENKIKPLLDRLDEVRDIDGYPKGNDEDIIELSNPPFYTACPNPYIKSFIQEYGKFYDPESDSYNIKPYIGDITEGRSGTIYNAHPYHTKVPHKAIMKFIEHYTKPGDIIFDGFCGTGMTGIASQILGRNAIISDLSPIATFIAYNYNMSINEEKFEKEATKLIQKIGQETKWMYETTHTDTLNNGKTKSLYNFIDIKNNKKGEINYIIWSDIFICSYCKQEYIFWEVAFDKKIGKIKDKYNCPNCSAEIKKTECERLWEEYDSSVLGKMINFPKQVPVLINYFIGKKRFEKKPDDFDLKLLKKIEKNEIPYWFPINEMPEGYNTRQPRKSHNITNVYQFYTKRNLWVVSKIRDEINNIKSKIIRHKLLFLINSYDNKHTTKMTAVCFKKGSKPVLVGYTTGTLYISSLPVEKNVLIGLKRKLSSIKKLYQENIKGNVIVSTNSITNLSLISDNSIDYIFTDPPFGGNLMYSELSFIWESWLKVFTKNETEAIINKAQNKELKDYINIMSTGFKEMYRILKPNRWITVEFHNSKASVWNGIQEAMNRAGFIIAQVAVLDKKQGTLKQITAAGAVAKDLVINAYKPELKFAYSFLQNAGEDMEADFISQQLEHLPIKSNLERTEKMLYSRMLAHYVENGFKIKFDATNFYKILMENFIESDGCWFLSNQISEYNRWKSNLSLDGLKIIIDGQQTLFVADEKSALAWIYFFLDKPKDFNEIFTAYQKVLMKSKDNIPEPRILLDSNFILEDGKYRRPLNREEKQRVNKSREKELKREFSNILKRAIEQKGKIKNIRLEVLLYGFTNLYKEEKYDDILIIANKLDKSILDAFVDIMDFIDIARLKTQN